MSRYDWEAGTIKLPTAEFSRVRKAVEVADREHKEQVFAATQDFWKGLSRKEQTDPEAYRKAVFRYADEMYRGAQRQRTLSGSVYEQLERVSRSRWDPQTRRQVFGKPRRVQVADMGYPTNRTTVFQLPSGATIAFDRDTSSVSWSTGENNHQVERAHDDPLAQVLFAELGKVRWTRGTGGVLSGNDEYNQGSREAGLGGNYVTTGFGPIGAADPQAWSRTDDYTDSTGKRVTRDRFPGHPRASASGGRGRVPAGVRTGGQFTTRGRGESGVSLR